MDITAIDGKAIEDLHRASCYCGEVQIDVSLPNVLKDVRRYDCWMCRRRGAIVASVELDDIAVVWGQNRLREYQFNTMTARTALSLWLVWNLYPPSTKI